MMRPKRGNLCHYYGETLIHSPSSVPHQKRSLDSGYCSPDLHPGDITPWDLDTALLHTEPCNQRNGIQKMKGCRDSSQAGEFLQPWGSQLTNCRKQTSVHAVLSVPQHHTLWPHITWAALSFFSNTSIIPSFSHYFSCLTMPTQWG